MKLVSDVYSIIIKFVMSYPRHVSAIHLLITQYTYRFYTKLKTTKKKTIKYSKLYIIELK